MMDHSMVLLNAQVQFLETKLAIVHIPLHLYPHFIQPVLRLLTLSDSTDEVDGLPRRKWAYPNAFTNISVTTIECSVVCPRPLVDELFRPLIERLDAKAKQAVIISNDDFVVIQVGGEGMEAGQRVLDLTAPLALAGISIFFITSYYSDFVLVPYNSKSTVISALEERGFAFEPISNGHGANMTNISSPLHSHNRNSSSSSSLDSQPPGTPPPATVAEWQTKTFSTLHRNDILPLVDETLELRTCAGYRSDSNDVHDAIMLGVFRCLLTNPRFMSITLTQTDTVSITLDQQLLSNFPESGEGILLQNDQTYFAIVFDLRKLPEESTGIICGVAGRLLERLGDDGGAGEGAAFNMSYLSTARTGNVIVQEDEVHDALEALLEEEALSVDSLHRMDGIDGMNGH
ncbi:hypothetical protein D6D08_05919 [Aureobasidium pullulans]|nr:hypothetical protein D6D08_05919 [Aureobasidium pullulans]